VRGSVVDIRFDAHLPPIYSVLHAGGKGKIVIEVLAQLDAHHVRGIALTPTQGLARGMAVEDTGGPLKAPVGKGFSRACSTCSATPSTAKPPPDSVQWRTVHRAPPPLARRSTKSEIFETGIKVIDVLVPLERGGKAGLFGGAGVGKTVLAHRNDPQHDRAPRGRQHFLRHRRTVSRRRGALPRDEGSRRVAEHGDGLRPDERAAGQPVPRGPRRADDGRVFPGRRAPRRAAADRQYLPLHPGRHGGVRLDGADAVASGLSAHDGHRAVGLEERIANTDTGAITSIQAVYVPADDFTDPAAVHTFSHLSASIVLSRKRASEGLYPGHRPAAVQFQNGHAGHRRRTALSPRAGNPADARAIRGTQGHHCHARPGAAFAEDRNVVARARRLERFLTQPFFTTEQFTGLKGKLVSLKDALDGCERILRDEFKDYPESALYMIGAIDEAKKKAKPGQPKAEPESKTC
jgi:F-type H+-transporting ATPase subunit beta